MLPKTFILNDLSGFSDLSGFPSILLGPRLLFRHGLASKEGSARYDFMKRLRIANKVTSIWEPRRAAN